MLRVVVTGFQPFRGLDYNPSEAVLSLLPSRLGSAEIQTAVLPVSSRRVRDALEEIHRRSPSLLLHTGLAQDRPTLSLERFAVNLLDFEAPDNDGETWTDTPIVASGPLALQSRLPVRSILGRLDGEGIGATLSLSAGAFLCNQVMYMSLHSLPESTPTGFFHLAPDEVLAGRGAQFHQPLVQQARAIVIGIEATLESMTRGPS